MGKKLIKCGFAGGLVMFLWGMLAWTVFSWHQIHMQKFKDEVQVVRVMAENAPQSGLYLLPNLLNLSRESEEMIEGREEMSKGPFMFVSISLSGKSPEVGGPILEVRETDS